MIPGLLRAAWGRSTVRYLFIGGVLFLLDLAAFLALKHLGIGTVPAQVVSRTVGAAAGFAGHKLVSFRNREQGGRALAAQGTSYAVLTVVNILISPLVVVGFEHLLGWAGLPVVKVAAEVVMVTETYLVLRWVFRGRRAPGGEER